MVSSSEASLLEAESALLKLSSITVLPILSMSRSILKVSNAVIFTITFFIILDVSTHAYCKSSFFAHCVSYRGDLTPWPNYNWIPLNSLIFARFLKPIVYSLSLSWGKFPIASYVGNSCSIGRLASPKTSSFDGFRDKFFVIYQLLDDSICSIFCSSRSWEIVYLNSFSILLGSAFTRAVFIKLLSFYKRALSLSISTSWKHWL